MKWEGINEVTREGRSPGSRRSKHGQKYADANSRIEIKRTFDSPGVIGCVNKISKEKVNMHTKREGGAKCVTY